MVMVVTCPMVLNSLISLAFSSITSNEYYYGYYYNVISDISEICFYLRDRFKLAMGGVYFNNWEVSSFQLEQIKSLFACDSIKYCNLTQWFYAFLLVMQNSAIESLLYLNWS